MKKMRHRSDTLLLTLAAGIACIAVTVAMNLSAALGQSQTSLDKVPEWQKAAGGKLSFDMASIKRGSLAARKDRFISVNLEKGIFRSITS